jgi:pimeloyl-ACP methyl ester carboxylesterase
MPLVFAPGLSCDARLWNAVRARLGGRCSLVADFTHASSLPEMADEILRVGAPRFVLAGFSLGGMAAIAAAALAPCRVAGLLVMSTHVEADTAQRLAARKRQLALARPATFQAYVRTELVPGYFGDPDAHDAFGPLLEDMALALGPAVFARQVRALTDRPDLAALAGRVHCPTRVLGGLQDRVAPPSLVARMAEALPCAGAPVLADCGHAMPLEAPSVVAEAIADLQARLCAKGETE